MYMNIHRYRVPLLLMFMGCIMCDVNLTDCYCENFRQQGKNSRYVINFKKLHNITKELGI